MDKRYQVFISSTYTDLKEERKAVMQALMEMDCIPAGMEMFPATDEEQFEFIKKIIDDCDYYLLVIGGRYGSIAPDGLSYTEKEFDYAVSKGVKIVALIHGSTDNIPQGKSEITYEAIEKLKLFREKVSTGRLVKYWQETKELPGLVALSLQKTIKIFPAIGWVRANKVAGEELLAEINELRKQNKELSEQLISSKPISSIKNIADFDSKITLHTYYEQELTPEFDFETTWKEIFSLLAPQMYQKSLNENIIESYLCNMHPKGFPKDNFAKWGIVYKDIKTIAFQLTAYGLIDTDYSSNPPYWILTNKGEQLILEYCTVKANQEN